MRGVWQLQAWTRKIYQNLDFGRDSDQKNIWVSVPLVHFPFCCQARAGPELRIAMAPQRAVPGRTVAKVPTGLQKP